MADQIKFYTDSHVAKAVAAQLRRRGVDIVRCQDVGMANAKDHEHLAYATAQERTVVTSDEDFIALDAEWRKQGNPHCGVVYIRPHNREAIGTIVRELLFYHEAVVGGAATLERDVYNQVNRV